MKHAIRIRLPAAFVGTLLLLGFFVRPAFAQEQGTPLPTSKPASLAEAAADAVSGATTQGGSAISPNFLGLNVSVKAHKATGYAAGGLFAAAGVVGGIRFLDLMNRSHEYRTDGEGEDDAFTATCRGIIQEEWASGQELRWTHVGLIAGGESLYLFDAVTGMSMIKKDGPTTRAGKIHRTAFFVHAGLMLAEMVLGFLETDALQRGDHEMIVKYGAAHTGMGIAIPVVIIGSGLAIDLYPGVEVPR